MFWDKFAFTWSNSDEPDYDKISRDHYKALKENILMEIGNELKACACGRSKDGQCDGSHKLTNEEYAKKIAQQKEQLQENILLNESK